MTKQNNETNEEGYGLTFLRVAISMMVLGGFIYAIYYVGINWGSNNAVAPENWYPSYPPHLTIYYEDVREPIFNEELPFFQGFKIKIGNFTDENNGKFMMQNYHITYYQVKDELNISKSMEFGIKNISTVASYIKQRKFFFVDNPNSQMNLNGDIKLTGSGSSTGYSFGCKFIFCGSESTSSSMKLNLEGTISLAGEIKTPISIIDEKELYPLVKDNFVKCYFQEFDVYTSDNQPLRKLICGVEKNNVFVVSEITSVEQDTKICNPVRIPLIINDYPWKDIEINPKTSCSEVWK